MLKSLKQSWHRFQADSPGRRFKQQFRRWRESGRTRLTKVLFIAAGVLLMAIGILLLFIPGPGIPTILLGALLLAQQSWPLAKALDRTEVRLRNRLMRSWRSWRAFLQARKLLLVAVALFVIGLVGFAAFNSFAEYGGSRMTAWLRTVSRIVKTTDANSQPVYLGFGYAKPAGESRVNAHIPGADPIQAKRSP
jgi:uncharacterized membrane protein YbaN (DUF454 family)